MKDSHSHYIPQNPVEAPEHDIRTKEIIDFLNEYTSESIENTSSAFGYIGLIIFGFLIYDLCYLFNLDSENESAFLIFLDRTVLNYMIWVFFVFIISSAVGIFIYFCEQLPFSHVFRYNALSSEITCLLFGFISIGLTWIVCLNFMQSFRDVMICVLGVLFYWINAILKTSALKSRVKFEIDRRKVEIDETLEKLDLDW